MKQNIFGVILFSIIVGTAVIVSEFFVVLPIPPAIEEKPLVFESKSRGGKTHRNDFGKIKLTQAVLNPKTNQLFTSLMIERPNSSADYMGLTYHFYTKEGAETRYLASETVAIRPDFNSKEQANHEITPSYAWLDSLVSKNNIYVMAIPESNCFSKSQSIPRFDELNATPVLLMKDKN